jgi:hypothetical protein
MSWRGAVALLALAALAVAAVLLLGEPTSPSGRTLESMFEDDQLLVDQPLTPAGNAEVGTTLHELKSLGVDRIRVIVVWRQVAPDDDSRDVPAGFDAADPADYASGWEIYDRIDAAAALVGIKVYFDITAPAPRWALTAQPADTDRAARSDAEVYAPSATAFKQFVEAAGRRYSGTYRPPDAAGQALPRVSMWSVWNEPNQPGWLSPQENPATGAARAPALYRSLADAFWSGLIATGHGPARDTILIGELAPEGCVSGVRCAFAGLGAGYSPIPPLGFLADLYCVAPAGSGRDRPLQGAAATAVGCPSRPDAASFAAENPALFNAAGLAEHPYDFNFAPNVPFTEASESGFVPLASLGKLTAALDGFFSAYHQSGQLGLYLTEYGYVTNPPNPDYHVTLAEQARYLDQATYIAAQNPRVRALAQFQLQDADPALSCGCAPGNPKYWQTFEEGLEFLGGAPKPALAAYRLPIFLPQIEDPGHSARTDSPVTVWGMLRPAADHSTETAQIQFQPAAGGGYRTIATTTTRNRSGIVSGSVLLSASGSVRLAWSPPGAATPLYSRVVAVTVRP